MNPFQGTRFKLVSRAGVLSSTFWGCPGVNIFLFRAKNILVPFGPSPKNRKCFSSWPVPLISSGHPIVLHRRPFWPIETSIWEQAKLNVIPSLSSGYTLGPDTAFPWLRSRGFGQVLRSEQDGGVLQADGSILYVGPNGKLETLEEQHKRLRHNARMRFNRSFDSCLAQRNKL